MIDVLILIKGLSLCSNNSARTDYYSVSLPMHAYLFFKSHHHKKRKHFHPRNATNSLPLSPPTSSLSAAKQRVSP